MKNIYILLFLLIAFSTDLLTDDFDEFWYEDEVLTADEENLILLGSIMDGENVTGGAVVFDLDDYSYRSLIFENINPYHHYWEITTNSINKLIGIQTDSNFIIYNYLNGEYINELDLTLSSSEIINFSTKSNQLYIINYITDSLNIIDIETGNSIEKKNIELMSEGYNYRSFNEYENYVVLTKGDSVVYFDLENDSIINKIKSSNEFDKLQFTDSGNLLVGIDSNIVIISNSSDFSLIRELDLDEVIMPQNSGISYDIWFSNKGKYMYINPTRSSFMNIVDTESDTLIARTGSRYHTDRMFPLFISPDKSKAIGLENGNYYCDRGQIPRVYPFPLIYKFIENERLSPVPNTFVKSPAYAVFGNSNEKIAVVTDERLQGNDYTTIMDSNLEFLQFVNIDDYPVLFMDNDNYLVYENDGNLNFYSLEKEEYDKVIELGLTGDVKCKYISNHRKLLAFNNDSIVIIDYNDLIIEDEYSIGEIGLDSNLKFSGEEKIFSYSSDTLRSFNPIAKTIQSIQINDIPEGYEFKDFSPDGNYILYRKENYMAGLYYSKTKKFKKFNLLNNIFNEESELISFMLLGNSPLLYYSTGFESYPISYFTYDFDLNKSIDIGKEVKFVNPFGNTRKDHFSYIAYSSDYSTMLGITCPTLLTLHKFPEPTSSVEVTETEEILLYPNPIKAELKLDKLDYNQLTNVGIYDSYGKLVLTLGTVNTSERLNIENLPAGVYFLKSNEFQHKFLKY